MSARPSHILVVAAARGDLGRVLPALCDGGFVFAHVHALTELPGPSAGPWDAAVVDCAEDVAEGLAACQTLRRWQRDLPVAVVLKEASDGAAPELQALQPEARLSAEGLEAPILRTTLSWLLECAHAEREHRQLERLLDAAPDAAIVVDASGVVHYVNGPALVFFGRERDELVAERILFAAPPGTTVELRVNRGKSERVGELRVLDVEWRGERGFLAVIRDVTQQRQLEMQVLMSDRLASLGTLAAGVGHEINNPLTAVIGNVDRALEALDAPGSSTDHTRAEMREGLHDAREAAERIRQITRDLKVFARTHEDERQTVDVHRLLDSVARMAGNEILHRARLTKSYGQVASVWGSEARLSQVFLNLIVNAAQAIPEGAAERNEIALSTGMTAAGLVQIAVEDSGPGIPEDVQRRLFTPFFTTKPVGTGTGLGLAISQRIVQAMGGDITFQSTVGKGTRFEVHLPAAEAALRRDPPSSYSPRPQSARGRVLVIDDDAALLRIVRRALDRDHALTCCDRAAKALELIQSGERFDVVLCDLMMPEMSGIELVRALEACAPDQVERVILMTGGAFTKQAGDFLDLVNYPRLEKPFDLARIRDVVQAAVDQARRPAAEATRLP